MKTVFISHRTSDGERADRIYSWLGQRIPKEDIFFDKDGDQSIGLGSYFDDEIEQAAREAQLMIIVIGPSWAKERLSGFWGLIGGYRNRIQEQGDWVRQEIEIARKSGAAFLIVLIDETKLPKEKDLPTELRWLHRVEFYNLRRDHDGFEQGMRKIAAAIDQKLPRKYGLNGPQAKLLSVAVPRPNRLFTGRENVLARLHAAFQRNPETRGYVAVALRGLGGMGKTQTAIKYAYLYGSEYQHILWANADTRDRLLASFKTIAAALNLPETNHPDPQRVIDAVKKWLRDNSGWLLVLDNADTPSIVDDFLPGPNSGHILLTTRNPGTEVIADPIMIDSMDTVEGTKFLLLRANIPEPTTDDQRYARLIVQEMGGLPLGIEQAGAYIAHATTSVEVRRKRLATYLDIFREQRVELLKFREERDDLPNDKRPEDTYRDTVATTWRLFALRSKRYPGQSTVYDRDPAAIDLLCLSAFLAPDAIPEELFADGGPSLGSELGPISAHPEALQQVFETLESFSLIQRTFDMNINRGAFSVHRLVQAVIQDDLAPELQRLWAERATRAVNRVFPPKNVDKKETWALCERYLPHALACSDQVKKYGLVTPEAVAARATVNPDDATHLVSEVVQLLNQAGTYLRVQSRFADAVGLLQQAWNIREDISGPDAIETAKSIDSLARLYFDRYMYRQAKPLYTRALAIREAKLGPRDKAVADTLNRLGLTCWYIGYRDAKNEQERANFYDQAGQLLARALPISEELLGPESQLTLNIRNNQALLYRSLHEYAQAVTVNQQVLAIREAKVKQARSANEKADLLEQEAVQSQQNLAVTYYQEQQAAMHKDVAKYAMAEDLLVKVREFRLRRYANQPYHFQIARCQRYLALVHMAQNKDWQAKGEFEQALDIWDKSLDNPAEVMEAREEYRTLLLKVGLHTEADKVQKEIDRLRSQHPQE